MDIGAKVCPICGRSYSGFPAISRKDNATEICPECGRKEAAEIYAEFLRGKTDE